MLEMVNLHRPQVMVHMAYLKTGRIWEFKSKPKSIRAIPLPKTLLFWACTVAMACLGKCVALWCWSNLDFLDVCSPLTIVSFVVDYHHPKQFMPGAGFHRSSHVPPCASCPYAGACPWCYIR
jgi:hypothetical protein